MDPAARDAFLKAANIVVLATCSRDGRPYAAPFWYLYQDGIFKISVGRNSRTHRNVAHQPAVALVLERRVPPYYSVRIRGAASIEPPFDQPTRVRLAERYFGRDLAREYIAKRPTVDAVTLSIRPDNVSEYEDQTG